MELLGYLLTLGPFSYKIQMFSLQPVATEIASRQRHVMSTLLKVRKHLMAIQLFTFWIIIIVISGPQHRIGNKYIRIIKVIIILLFKDNK